MGTHIKTTIDIADDLFLKAKATASKNGITLRDLVENGLRTELERCDVAPSTYKPVTWQGGELSPEFKGSDWDQILEAIYTEGPQ